MENFLNEKMVKLEKGNPIYDKVKKTSLGFYSEFNVDYVATFEGGIHYVVKLHGGLNGSGDWQLYLDDVKQLMKNISNNCWLVCLNNNCLDDVFDIEIGFRI